MATESPPHSDVNHFTDSDEESLSDEAIQQLLKDAEIRLRARAASQQDHNSRATSSAIILPKLEPGPIPEAYIETKDGIARAEASRLVDKSTKDLSNSLRKVEDPVIVKERINKERKATAGESWFNLPKLEMTSEQKRDLQLLAMRGVLDPKRFYKKEKLRPPEYGQIGTVIEGNTEFYSARLTKKERKRTFVEEVLAQEADTGRFKRKFNEIQSAKASGKKAFYKALKEKRKRTKK